MTQLLDPGFLLGHLNYWLFVVLMMTGLYIVVARGNLLKKIVGLNVFQTAVFLLYISMGKISGGTAPIIVDAPDTVYSNPLPHVLILTAIVVGVATTALGLALIVRINESYATIEEDEILELDRAAVMREAGAEAEPADGAAPNERSGDA